MKLSIELTPAEEAKLREAAARLGVEPTTLAHAAVSDLLAASDESFEQAAERMLRRNEELYRRLA